MTKVYRNLELYPLFIKSSFILYTYGVKLASKPLPLEENIIVLLFMCFLSVKVLIIFSYTSSTPIASLYNWYAGENAKAMSNVSGYIYIPKVAMSPPKEDPPIIRYSLLLPTLYLSSINGITFSTTYSIVLSPFGVISIASNAVIGSLNS